MVRDYVKVIRASSLARYMACGGFAYMKNLPKQEAGTPAQEGTAAGEMLQRKLEAKNPDLIVEGAASNGYKFDSDMAFYTSHVAREILEIAVGDVLCEQRVDWTTTSGIVIQGQYDIMFRDARGDLHVHDLKYGWGIVEAFENWQLLAYSIGVLLRTKNEQLPKRVYLTIHQPRPHHEDGPVRTWMLDVGEIWLYHSKINETCSRIAAGEAELVSSSKCRYCPAAQKDCPSFNRAFYNSVDVALRDFKQDELQAQDIASQLELLERVQEIFKIKKESLEQLAVSRMVAGEMIPGYATMANYGDRKWKSFVTPEAFEVMTGKRIVVEEMLSPAKVEKLGVPKDLIATLVDRPFIGQKLKRIDESKLGDKIFGKGAPK